jgi:hypothetical protein
MKLFRIFAIAAMAMLAGASAQAGVQLSNMGAGGTTDTSLGGNQDQNSIRQAVGFTTGLTNLKLDSISAVLFGASSPAEAEVTLGVYASTGGNPDLSSAIATKTRLVGERSVQTFDFSGNNVVLSANTLYYVAISSTASWYFHGGDPPQDPAVQPGSDWSFSGVKRKVGSGSWENSSVRPTFSISSTDHTTPAVPEPALTSLICLSGIALIRRRMKK